MLTGLTPRSVFRLWCWPLGCSQAHFPHAAIASLSQSPAGYPCCTGMVLSSHTPRDLAAISHRNLCRLCLWLQLARLLYNDINLWLATCDCAHGICPKLPWLHLEISRTLSTEQVRPFSLHMGRQRHTYGNHAVHVRSVRQCRSVSYDNPSCCRSTNGPSMPCASSHSHPSSWFATRDGFPWWPILIGSCLLHLLCGHRWWLRWCCRRPLDILLSVADRLGFGCRPHEGVACLLPLWRTTHLPPSGFVLASSVSRGPSRCGPESHLRRSSSSPGSPGWMLEWSPPGAASVHLFFRPCCPLARRSAASTSWNLSAGKVPALRMPHLPCHFFPRHGATPEEECGPSASWSRPTSACCGSPQSPCSCIGMPRMPSWSPSWWGLRACPRLCRSAAAPPRGSSASASHLRHHAARTPSGSHRIPDPIPAARQRVVRRTPCWTCRSGSKSPPSALSLCARRRIRIQPVDSSNSKWLLRGCRWLRLGISCSNAWLKWRCSSPCSISPPHLCSYPSLLLAMSHSSVSTSDNRLLLEFLLGHREVVFQGPCPLLSSLQLQLLAQPRFLHLPLSMR